MSNAMGAGKGMGKTTVSDAEGPKAAAGAAPVPAPTPDLALVAAQIAEEFPLVLEQTSLVLLDVDPEHLHAFWTLAQEDLARTQAAFPTAGRAPERIIRLRRLHPDGAAEDVTTLTLDEQAQGDARFPLANDDAAYQAEIGLRSPQGGWVLLTRSNQTRLPRPVGVPIPGWTGIEPEPPAGPRDQIPALAKAQAPSGVAPVPGNAGITTLPGSGYAASEPPLVESQVRPMVPVQPPSPGTRPARWVLDTALSRGTAQPAPDVGATNSLRPEPAGPGSNADVTNGIGSAETSPLDRPWQPAIPKDWRWPDQAGSSEAPTPDQVTLAGPTPWPAPFPVPAPAGSARDVAVQPQPPGPISSFALGRGPEAPLVEAELLVHVSARPGTLVELYGRPLRVGPSGRSSLRVPVTDLGLLEQLLDWEADPGGSKDHG
jgi:hypothetical protein